MTDEQLLKLNHLGLIPGPDETSEAFAQRAEYCLKLKENLSEDVTSLLSDEGSHPEVIKEANGYLETVYDLAPSWIPIFFSNYRLPFWQGGCAWIFQMSEGGPTASLIQLQSKFAKASTYMGIYDRKELMAHELVHVGRMAFQEPRFEELLAYNTSTSSFRRWFGPIVKSAVESVVFILVLGLLMVFDVFLIALDRPDAYEVALWLKIIPISLIIYALWRLWRLHWDFSACMKRLSECLDGDIRKARAVIYRLTDAEIEAFSKMSVEEIFEYARQQGATDLRWQLIGRAYLQCPMR